MNSLTTYVIKEGDTLQLIAQRLLGDANKSLDIAVFNNLDYPFVMGVLDTIPTGISVVVPGDTILIPKGDTASAPPEDSNEDLYNFGSDLLLDRSARKGNISIISSGELGADIYGDLQCVSGVSCLLQDVINRLVTPLGTLPYHPEYGSTLLDIVGSKRGADWQQKATVELARTIRCDPRVQDVKGVSVSLVDTGVLIDCNVVSESQQYSLNTIITTGGV